MQFRVRRQTLIGDIYDGRIHMATIGDGLVRLLFQLDMTLIVRTVFVVRQERLTD